MNEQIKEIITENPEEIIHKTIQKFHFGEKDGIVDLRDTSNKDVIDFFYSLKETDKFVFHGTNAEDKFDFLEARQANDASKESGNKKAVYADAGVTAPIATALLNKKYLNEKFQSFITGWDSKDGKMTFKFSPNIYELFKSNDINLFSDGYVYVLDKSHFKNAEDAGTEWHTEENQKPILSCKISRNLANDIYNMKQGDEKTVYEYSPEEMKRIEEFNK